MQPDFFMTYDAKSRLPRVTKARCAADIEHPGDRAKALIRWASSNTEEVRRTILEARAKVAEKVQGLKKTLAEVKARRSELKPNKANERERADLASVIDILRGQIRREQNG